jgi:hypothetical protein
MLQTLGSRQYGGDFRILSIVFTAIILSGWSVLVGETPFMKKSIIAGKPAPF